MRFSNCAGPLNKASNISRRYIAPTLKPCNGYEFTIVIYPLQLLGNNLLGMVVPPPPHTQETVPLLFLVGAISSRSPDASPNSPLAVKVIWYFPYVVIAADAT